MKRRSCFILACLSLALPCIARAAEEGPVVKKELSNVFVGMKLDEGNQLLKSLGEELFTSGVTLKSRDDGSVDQTLGLISAGWKVGERAVVRLRADEDGKVAAIGLYDARMYDRGKDAFASSQESVSSLVFFGDELVMKDGKLLKKEATPAPLTPPSAR